MSATNELGASKDETVAVLKVKVDILTETIGEIKNALKRIEEIVGVIRIIEVQSKQQSKDFDNLTATVQALSKSVEEVEVAINNSIQEGDYNTAEAAKLALQEVSKKLKDVSEKLDNLEKDWKEKYNFGRGVWWVISLIAGTVIAALMYVANSNYTKIEEVHNWMTRERIVKEVQQESKVAESKR
jgi:hypothetical protein